MWCCLAFLLGAGHPCRAQLAVTDAQLWSLETAGVGDGAQTDARFDDAAAAGDLTVTKRGTWRSPRPTSRWWASPDPRP